MPRAPRCCTQTTVISYKVFFSRSVVLVGRARVHVVGSCFRENSVLYVSFSKSHYVHLVLFNMYSVNHFVLNYLKRCWSLWKIKVCVILTEVCLSYQFYWYCLIGVMVKGLVDLLFFDLCACFHWVYCKYCPSPISYFCIKCSKVSKVLFSKMWCRCVMAFSFYLTHVLGYLLTRNNGLCTMGVCELGDIVKFVILLTFHQADRVVAVTVLLKQLCFFHRVAKEG